MPYWFIFQDDNLLLPSASNEQQLLDENLLAELSLPLLRQHPIGEFQGELCYCGEIAKDIPLPSHLEIFPLRKAFNYLSQDWFRAVLLAYSIINWDRNSKFCGRCGHLTERKSISYEKICPHCGLAHYPRISPSIIVLIKRDDHLLMARSPHFPLGAYALIAGFVEVGESVEETIHREVQEEVGIQVDNLSYFGSQPWPFPDSLMLGFFADYKAGEIMIDSREIENAGWYRFDNLPGFPSHSISIARRLIDHFVAEQTKKYS